MIIDQLGVFFDDTPAAAAMTSNTVYCMPYAGRPDSACISVIAKGENATPLTYTVTIEESPDGVAFTALDSFSLTKATTAPAMHTARLPAELKERYVRLSVAASGTPEGTLFAALTRDHFAGRP